MPCQVWNLLVLLGDKDLKKKKKKKKKNKKENDLPIEYNYKLAMSNDV